MNLDSEDEGELYVGCAGGEDVNVLFNYSEEETPEGVTGMKMSVTGMKGGHSGIDIPFAARKCRESIFQDFECCIQ